MSLSRIRLSPEARQRLRREIEQAEELRLLALEDDALENGEASPGNGTAEPTVDDSTSTSADADAPEPLPAA
jgi:hypothetical protein